MPLPILFETDVSKKTTHTQHSSDRHHYPRRSRCVQRARASSALILGRVSLCFERAVLLVGDGEDLMRLGSGSGLGLTVRSSAVGVGVNSAWAASSCVSCSLCEIESLSTKASSNLREREMEGGKEGAHQGVRNTPCTREPTPRTVTWSLH